VAVLFLLGVLVWFGFQGFPFSIRSAHGAPSARAFSKAGSPGSTRDAVLEVIDLVDSLGSRGSEEALWAGATTLARRWSRVDSSLGRVSDKSSPVERLWRSRVERAAREFGEAAADSLLRRDAMVRALEAVRDVKDLLPVIGAIEKGDESVVLLVSSVACSCALARCERMTLVFDELLRSKEGAPLARIDDMNVPELAQAWEIYDVPAWVFLDSQGNLGFKFEGETSEESIVTEVKDWLDRRTR
jgi:hypothetical protein